jgi:tripartite-type tricarboxylate transporter receptor subunit TctC
MRPLRECVAAGLIAIVVAFPVSTHAQQDYPNRPIKLVCGFVAGSGADVVHRYFAEKLRPIAGVPIIVENKPGASGNLAHSYVANSKPDGYTVYPVGGSTLAASMHIFKTPPIDPLKDLEPTNTLLKQGWLVVVDAKSPFTTLPALTAHLKEKKEKASYSTATVPGTVMGEIYKRTAGLQMVQVNYKTIGDSLTDLLSGHIDVMFADAAYTLREMQNGRLRPLAISTAKRMNAMPDIPTMAEGGVPGMDLVVWWAVMVPAGTPQPIKDRLRGWFDQILRTEETEKFLRSIGTDVYISTPEETSAFLAKEIKTWGDYIRLAGIQPE